MSDVEIVIEACISAGLKSLEQIFTGGVAVDPSLATPVVRSSGSKRSISGSLVALIGLGLNHGWDLDHVCSLKPAADGDWETEILPRATRGRNFREIGFLELARIAGCRAPLDLSERCWSLEGGTLAGLALTARTVHDRTVVDLLGAYA